jgi:hypothetical protein
MLICSQQTGAKLTKEQVVEIEELLIAGQSRHEIARRFGVSRRTIWTIDWGMHGLSSLPSIPQNQSASCAAGEEREDVASRSAVPVG